MPTDYVEDYEEVTGKKPEDTPVIETKVIQRPEPTPVAPATVADTK